MRFVRYGAPGHEKPGLLDAHGRIRDLSGHVADIDAQALVPGGLAQLALVDPATLPLAPEGVRIGCPVSGVGKFVAVGLNYADHAANRTWQFLKSRSSSSRRQAVSLAPMTT